MQEVKPHKLQTIICPTHKELLLKLYPWAGFNQTNTSVLCGKCQNDTVKKNKKK